MNNEQLKYARKRAEESYKFKIGEVKAKYTQQQVLLSPAEKLVALKTGNFKIREDIGGNAYYLRDVIIFPGEKDMVFDKTGCDKELKLLYHAYTNLTDELVLGDNEEALKLLREFERFGS